MFTSLRFGRDAYYYVEQVSDKWHIFKMPYRSAIPYSIVGEGSSTQILAHNKLAQMNI